MTKDRPHANVAGGFSFTSQLEQVDRRSDSLQPWLTVRIVWLAVFLAAAYYAGAQLGLALTFKPHPIAALWPPNAILLAALLLARPRSWPLLLAAALAAHLAAELQGGVPLIMVLCWFVSNAFEALLGAIFIRRLIPGPFRFTRLRDLVLFLAFGVFMASFVSSFLDAAFVKMAGWGSGSKWSLLGGMRAVAQLVSYEIPVGMAVAGVVLWCGTLDLHAIVGQQYRDGVVTLLGWNALQSPFLLLLACILFFAGLAECQRTPFDMAEAESELVSGFNTEYSGLRWGMFAMAEYTEMLLVSALVATLFFGGYQSPVGEQWIVALPVWLSAPLHAVLLLLKMLAGFGLMMWIRWTLPRFRVDQVMRLCWLSLVPLCLLALFALALQLLCAGGATLGVAYGRLPARLQPDLGVVGHLVGWLAPLLVGAVVVRAARRRHDQVHPALRQLTGDAP